MEGIEHQTLNVNGINMHIAEKGEGPLILFIHGFPDLWYSWRHQITALASLGYRCVAPDLRGYGDTDVPANPTAYTSLLVADDRVEKPNEVADDVEAGVGCGVGRHVSVAVPTKVRRHAAVT